MKTWTGSTAPFLPGGEVNLLDIVVHLGRERRWGGFGSQEWTVLHHSMLVSTLWLSAGFPKEDLAYVMMHDFHEYILGDIPTPVKKLFQGVQAVELGIDMQIREKLRLEPMSPETARRVRICDLAALSVEASLFGPPHAKADIPEDFRKEVSIVLIAAFGTKLEDIFKARQSVGAR